MSQVAVQMAGFLVAAEAAEAVAVLVAAVAVVGATIQVTIEIIYKVRVAQVLFILNMLQGLNND
jgi:hypothetical protein